MSWKAALEQYTEEQIAKLEFAAEVQKERIEKAALDLTSRGEVDGIDIGALWPWVLKRREELAAGVTAAKKVVEDVVEAVVEAVEPEPVEEPAENTEEPEAPAEESAAEAKPAPRKRAPKKSGS